MIAGKQSQLKMPRVLKSKTDDPDVVKKIVAEWSNCPLLNEALDHEVTWCVVVDFLAQKMEEVEP